MRTALLFRSRVFYCLLLLSAPTAISAHTMLISPNGGESLDIGESFTIEWIVEIEHQLQDWDLWYSTTSNDGPWIDVAMNLPAGDPTAGSQHVFNWSIPNTPAEQAWVRIRQDNLEMDYYDVSDLPFSIVGFVLDCDFNGDGSCGIDDLNALLEEGPLANGVNAVPGVNDQFDLDGNGVLDLNDLDQWLDLAAAENGLASPYQKGDTDLDGTVDGVDFVAWNAHKFTSTLRWDHGNFDGNAVTDGVDFVLWNQSKFQSSDVSVVPEPAGGWLLLLALCCWLVTSP